MGSTLTSVEFSNEVQMPISTRSNSCSEKIAIALLIITATGGLVAAGFGISSLGVSHGWLVNVAVPQFTQTQVIILIVAGVGTSCVCFTFLIKIAAQPKKIVQVQEVF